MKGSDLASLSSLQACQFWHIWVVRVRYESVFQRNPFRSLAMNFGVVIEVRDTCGCAATLHHFHLLDTVIIALLLTL